MKSIKTWLLLVAIGLVFTATAIAGTPILITGPNTTSGRVDESSSSVGSFRALRPLQAAPAPASLEERARFYLETAAKR